MSDIRKLIPNIPLEETPNATLYERLWFKLDGAYERHRRARRALGMTEDAKRANELNVVVGLTKQRCQGLVEAIAIMSSGVLDEAEVQRMCVQRFKARQPKTDRAK